MTPERIAEIKARESKATPGPWEADPWKAGIDKPLTVQQAVGASHNRVFIAHARQDVPDLVAEVERLQALANYYRIHYRGECPHAAKGSPCGCRPHI